MTRVMQRQPGLIVLAVLNFVFAPAAVLAALVVHSFETKGIFGDANRSFGDADPTMKLVFAGFIAVALLLVVSGIGYLLRRRFARPAGTAFALIALALAGISIGSGSATVTLMILVCAVYPVLTIVLINSKYRAALVR
jgi:hypothetical protein